MNTKETDVNTIILDWLGHRVNNDYATAHRLLFLKDEGVSDEEPMDVESLKHFLQMISQRPSLTMNPVGEISASWVIGDYKLVIRFLEDGCMQFIHSPID